jgi:hypothetical protein
VIVLSALLVAIAWWLVVPPSSAEHAAQASPLEHGLIDRASGGADLRAAGEQELDRTQWVDRNAGVVRIPIDRAIDAVVADPRLIGARPSAVSDANVGLHPASSDASSRPRTVASPRVDRSVASDASPRPGTGAIGVTP